MYIVVRETHGSKKKMETFEEIRQALRDAEDRGLACYSIFGAHNEPCAYWVCGDYIITYLTDDETFNAEMLTEDMLDDLIFEER